MPAAEGLGLLLVLRAFSSGAVSMTGIEAVSNAVPAFRPTEWRNARTTLGWMVAMLVTLFAGLIGLIHLDGLVPRADETLLSQLGRVTFPSGPWYAILQATTALILLLAANTAFNDFPGCCSSWPGTGTRRVGSCTWATGWRSATGWWRWR
ncbi:hypothetical protein V2I01_18280 [Micromonospora sp. BRA006-A]|nr:hypothetical protein [Micromonospora sp. BRA006-A]